MRSAEPDTTVISVDAALKGTPLSSLNEDLLADLIEEDGRARLRMGLECSLARYLAAIPNLRSQSIALDAAIDVSLRSLLRGSASHEVLESSVRTLTDSYPDLAEQVRLASTLSLQLGKSLGAGQSDVDLQSRVGNECGPSVQEGGSRYRIVELIGSGSNGAVYRAEDRLLSDRGRPAEVAIKFLYPASRERTGSVPRLANASESLRRPHARLLEEARRTRRVVHRNVLQVLDFGVAPRDGAFVVAELIRGESLQDRFDRLALPMPSKQAAELIRDAARGVQAAHEAGVLHCDLKPSNILLDSDETPRVADFGAGTLLATSAADDAAPLGNVAFAAPEQFRGDAGSVNASTDVYALGGMLVYLLTRKYPNGDTYHSVRARHVPTGDGPKESEDPTTGIRDRDLAAICRKAIESVTSSRYQSAQELASELENWICGRPVLAGKPSRLHRTRLLLRRNTRVAWLVATGILISAALGAAVYARGKQLDRARTNAQSAEDVKARNRTSIEAAFQELKRLKEGGADVNQEDIRRTTEPILRENQPSAGL